MEAIDSSALDYTRVKRECRLLLSYYVRCSVNK